MTKVKDDPRCAGCPMAKIDCWYEKDGQKIHHLGSYMNVVPPTIGPSLRIVIAEAPGETENEEMKPLVGAAGKFFDKLLYKAGIQRDQLTLLNVVNCRPPNNNFPGTNESKFYISEKDGNKAIAHCIRAHVLPVLESRPWARLDILGGKALQWLFGKANIGDLRGSPLTVDTDEIKERIKKFEN